MRNFKTTMLILGLGCFALQSSAQEKPGFFAAMKLRTNDVVKTPTDFVLQPEFGYQGRVLGASVVGYTNSRVQTDQVLAVGAKLYAKLFTVDALSFKVGGEALYLIHERPSLKKWAFTPEASVSAPIYGRLSGEFAVLTAIHREVFRDWSQKKRTIIDRWAACEPGASFKLTYRIGGRR